MPGVAHCERCTFARVDCDGSRCAAPLSRRIAAGRGPRRRRGGAIFFFLRAHKSTWALPRAFLCAQSLPGVCSSVWVNARARCYRAFFFVRRVTQTDMRALAAAVCVCAVIGAGVPPPADDSWYGRAAHPSAAWRSVRDFGAVGDGEHDDTVALQAALNADRGVVGPKAPAVVYVPPGVYLVSDTLIVGGFTELRGCSTSRPVLRLAPRSPYGEDEHHRWLAMTRLGRSLRACVEEARAAPRDAAFEGKGEAGIYGAAAVLPAGDVETVLGKYLDIVASARAIGE